MSVLYVKHHRAHKAESSFFSHLRKRKFSALFVTFGLFLAVTALLLNIAVKASHKPVPKFAQITSSVSSSGDVKGVSIQEVIQSHEANLPPVPGQQTETPTPTPTKKLSKSYYTIAVYGDSMIDTMGERMEYLEGALKKKYPDTTFFLYNYGIGAQNAEDGLARFNADFKYKDRNFPSISKIDADIIVIGSFAYNPFSPHNKDKHWLNLTQIVKEALKKQGVSVYLLAEIAPLRRTFGKGPGGANWDEDTSYRHSGNIIEQLEATISLGKALNVPVIDAYHKSIASESTKEGKRELVDTHDGIHPGVKGHEFIAEIIADSLKIE